MTAEEQKSNWPDEVRLKMIEKSKFYPDDEQVYQYGFYDGYQYAFRQCQKRDELIKAQDELINAYKVYTEDEWGFGWEDNDYELTKLIMGIKQLKLEIL